MQKIDPSLLAKVPLSWFLGTLGMPGVCMAAGLLPVCQHHRLGCCVNVMSVILCSHATHSTPSRAPLSTCLPTSQPTFPQKRHDCIRQPSQDCRAQSRGGKCLSRLSVGNRRSCNLFTA